jgi:hypothetical protein
MFAIALVMFVCWYVLRECVRFTVSYSMIATSLVISLAFSHSSTTSTHQLQHFVIHHWHPPAADFCSENAGG